VAEPSPSHASLLADFSHLSLSAKSSRGVASNNRHQRRNALTEGEFKAAFPSPDALQRLRSMSLRAIASRSSPSVEINHDLANLSLDEGEAERLTTSPRQVRTSQRRSLPACATAPPLLRGRRRNRRRSGAEPGQVASITLHEDLLTYRVPDVLPNSLVRHQQDSPQAQSNNQLMLYRPPSNLMEEILSPSRRTSRRLSGPVPAASGTATPAEFESAETMT